MSSRGEYREKRQRSRSPRREREDWRDVRIKNEPMSDVEGPEPNLSSRSNRYSEDRLRPAKVRSDRDDRESGRSHRDRDHHPPITRGGGGRDRERNYRRTRSKSRDRDTRESRDRPTSRTRSTSRDTRDRSQSHKRDRFEERPIKAEPRSRSRSPSSRAEPRRHRNTNNLNDLRRDRGDSRGNDSEEVRSSAARPREPKRERDWDNFFNPQSQMSQQAVVKRENNEVERAERIRDAAGQSGSGGEEDKKNVEKEKPNFGLSGKLTEETNTYRGVVIKYSEPPEARKPIKTRWRLYPFKEGEQLEVMYVHRQSAYLLGRERKIADIPIDHPSCSKQHAVIQYRLVPYQRPDGSKGRRIKPYIIDLESANGTFVNGERIDPKRYVELFEKDVLKFGFSSREYVLLHEHSKDDPIDDEAEDKSPSPE